MRIAINNLRDNLDCPTYLQLMAESRAQIVLNLSLDQPAELNDFVGAFVALSSQFERFIRAAHPDLTSDARVFVREIRPGSIEAVLLPLLTVIDTMDKVRIVTEFVEFYRKRISFYLKSGGRAPDASRGELQDLLDTVEVVANDPKGQSRIQAVEFEDKKTGVRAALKFDTKQARRAREQLLEHKREIETPNPVEHERVLMWFKRTDIGDATVGKRSGERVVIESISPKDLPLIYASELAEQRIKSEIRESSDNIFKKGFSVDVRVDTRGDRPVSYSVTQVHQIIDLDTED